MVRRAVKNSLLSVAVLVAIVVLGIGGLAFGIAGALVLTGGGR